MLIVCFFDLVNFIIQIVFQLNRLFFLLILISEFFGIFNHLINFALRKPSRWLNNNRLILSSGLILSRDLHNTISIDIETNFDLRNPSWSGRNSDQLELPHEFIIIGHISFSLKDSNADLALTISSCRVNLGLFSRNCGISFNDFIKNSSQSLNSQGKWNNIHQNDVFDVSF